MDGKEAIIKRIQSDAEKKAKSLIDNAENLAEEKKQEAVSWGTEYVNAQEIILERDCQEIIKRRLTVADLDVRKITLKEKQKAISDVLNKVYEKLCALKKADYLKFVLSLIEKNADEDDKIVLSSDKVLKSEDFKDAKIVKDKKLSVLDDVGEFKGGVYLVGKVCDKDLTFKALIENGKEIFVSEISQKLFGK